MKGRRTEHAAPESARGRAAFEERRWEDAFNALSEADGVAALGPEDLERLAWSAALTGRDPAMLATFERLYQLHLDAGALAPAARAAFWVGFRLLARGEAGQSMGWMARAQRVIDRAGDCAERGYLLIPVLLRHFMSNELEKAGEVAAEAIAVGERFGDRDLVAYARQVQGRALMRQGRMSEGLALLDEAMVAAKAGELSPLVTGLVYCSVIVICQQTYALDRAAEWIDALSRWCDAQPQLVTFTGTCLAHRAEILQLRGAWPEAIADAERAAERCLPDGDPTALASACYQRGEIHRLRGEFAAAETAYRAASANGTDPQPGLALLRLAQGQTAAAASAIRRVLAATTVPLQRTRFLPACVEIMLAAGDRDAAATAADEVEQIAAQRGSDVLEAIAGHARGAVRLAEGDAAGALAPLRRAFEIWRRVSAPYLAARVRVQLGRACRALGDEEGAGLEWDGAREVFERVGAAPDLAALEVMRGGGTSPPRVRTPAHAHRLSPRELEVLRLISRGNTNKEIAVALGLAEKTVDRHVSNIFGKIDVSTRAGATAFAFRNGLADPGSG